jgi:hypothetical protein
LEADLEAEALPEAPTFCWKWKRRKRKRQKFWRFRITGRTFSCSGLWFYLPSKIHHVCLLLLLVFGTDGNCNFLAVCSLIEPKLGGDLGFVSQISLHVLISRSGEKTNRKKGGEKR